MSTPVLRPYQVEAVEALRGKIRAGARRLVLVSPTGSGKTLMASEIIRAAAARGSRSLFMAHRKELIDQSVDKLDAFGVKAGVIMADDPRRDDWLTTQVASVQTLVRRLDRKPPAQLIIVDECHHATSATYRKIIDAYPEAITLGLTATPWRTDKIGLAEIYQDSVLARTPAELMRDGFLVEHESFAYDSPDLHKVKVTAGEFNQRDLAVACNTQILVGNIVREYLEHARGRSAMLFPVSIDHSMALCGVFERNNIRAAHLDFSTPKRERESIIERFRGGDIMVLSSVGVLTEGFDVPSAEVAIFARPTKSLTLHLQAFGRILRPSPATGKQRALIHDHAGNILRHGFPEDERDYSILATPDRVVTAHTCPACMCVFRRLNAGRCPNCNVLIAVPEDREEVQGRGIKRVVDGQRISREEIDRIRGRRAELGLTRPLTDDQIARAKAATREEKAAEYLRLRAVAERKGFKPGFVWHQFRNVFSHGPKFTDEELAAAAPAKRPFFPLPERA